ncbi:DUF3329 domain-containing protein [Dysgonomonas gadei]|uniref:Glycosyltransferase RgtA/B/C/D-like domain-containing protein n=1 Tax=Dysgonomonas gadei ATCC BAA-286 TaxID=742766 RepID=F5IVZ5_9BACT|nr:DUF6056 family protein [Dysgonomonas gadei]EGK02795.1 hypothetical protein HMPREF9455_01045 [Dysgonomonas gadei ATCC BAA-286]
MDLFRSMQKNSDASSKVLKVVFASIILILGVYCFLLNRLYPVYMDDWAYAFSACDESEITSVWDIFVSQYCHYFTWGGRCVGHFIAQFLLWINPLWADILNAAAFILLLLFIYAIANKNNKTNIIFFIVLLVSVWFLLPDLSQNLFWITGSANYLWGSLIILMFIYPFVSYYLDARERNNAAFRSVFLLLFGVIAGWTNENTSLAFVVFLIALVLIMRYQKIAVPKWMIFGIIGFIIGCIILQVSPGNNIRRKFELLNVHGFEDVSLSFYFYRFVTVIKLAYIYLFLPMAVYAGVLLIYLRKGPKDKIERRKKLILSFLFLGVALIATVVMSGAPYFPSRAWCGIFIFLIVAIMILYANIDISFLPLRIINYILVIVALVTFIYSAKETYSEMKLFDMRYKEWVVEIERQKKEGIQDIVVYTDFNSEASPFAAFTLKEAYVGEGHFWIEKFGLYMGVNTIRIKKIEDKNE